MSIERPRPSRHDEIDAIVSSRDGAVTETRDEADKYTVVGPSSRGTFANWLTPIDEHFVCHRNDVPAIDPETWTVSLTGRLEAGLSMDEIEDDHPTVAVAHTMECAGNGRGQHRPETGSVQWGCEAVGTAVWTGTPLWSVLRDHGVGPDDDGWVTAIGGDPSDGGDVFARSIPLSKALDDCVLAYGMNGRRLPREHGSPVRLIVPGWYGVNNVKWLAELRLMDTMVVEGSLDRPGSHAAWQQEAYRLHPRDAEPEALPTVDPVGTSDQLEAGVEHPYTFDATVMSLIGRPDGERALVRRDDGPVEIRGVAWAGDDRIERVEVSTDAGGTWTDADLFGPDYRGAWRLFRCDWDPDRGTYRLFSRATDDRGRRQPCRISAPDAWRDALANDEFPWNEGGYAANAYEPNGVVLEVLE